MSEPDRSGRYRGDTVSRRLRREPAIARNAVALPSAEALTLDAIAMHPEMAANLPAEDRSALLARCAAVLAALAATWSIPMPTTRKEASDAVEPLLSAQEVAARLGFAPSL